MVNNNVLVFKAQTFTEDLLRELRQKFDIPKFVIVADLMPVEFNKSDDTVLFEVTDNEKVPEVNIYYPMSWVIKSLKCKDYMLPGNMKVKFKLYLRDRSEASIILKPGDSFIERAGELSYCFKEHHAYDAWRKVLK